MQTQSLRQNNWSWRPQPYDHIEPYRWVPNNKTCVVGGVVYCKYKDFPNINSFLEVPSTLVLEGEDTGIYREKGYWAIRSNNSNPFYTFERLNPNIKRVFGVNLTCELEVPAEPIPFGCPRHEIFNEAKEWVKTNLLYLNCNVKTNRARERLYPLFSWGLVKKPNNTRLGKQEYYHDLLKSKFVICPIGNGYDTMRFLESLHSNCIAIIEDSFWSRKMEYLGALVVDKFEDVSEGFLKEKWVDFQRKDWNRKDLNKISWIRKIHQKAG